MKYALIRNNIVENVIVADQEFIDAHPEMYDIYKAFADREIYPKIGDSFDGKNFISAVIPDDSGN